MSIYFVGIDISKYKYDCCIISAADQQIVSKFTFTNDKDGFEQLLISLNSLSLSENIKIGFESTTHYALNPSTLNSSLKMLTTASWKLILSSSRNTKNQLL
jgi:hypothetical protein